MYPVETDGLTKYFPRESGKGDRLIAVDHVNLRVKEGEFFGLLGPNGGREDHPDKDALHANNS